jgi:cell division protein FtsB
MTAGAAAAHVRAAPFRRIVRPVVYAIVAAVVVLVLVFGVFPTRTWLQQRAAHDRAAEQLDVLAAENAKLDERIEALSTDAEIERLARQWYNLVRPGEEAYAVLPPPPAPVELPSVWPFGPIIEPAPAEGEETGVPVDE